eukprot:2258814-Amphidinium_carterae.1
MTHFGDRVLHNGAAARALTHNTKDTCRGSCISDVHVGKTQVSRSMHCAQDIPTKTRRFEICAARPQAPA